MSMVSLIHKFIKQLSVMVLVGGTLLGSYAIAQPLSPLHKPSELDYKQSTAEKSPKSESKLRVIEHKVRRGDTLSKILKRFGIGKNNQDYKAQLESLMEADLDILVLDVIKIKQKVQLWIDEDNQLQKIAVTLNPARQVVFFRSNDKQFEYKDIRRDGIWRTTTLKGQVKKSFYVSARNAKMTPSEIIFIESLLDTQINFAKDVSRGDKFTIIRKSQFIDGLPTGNNELIGVLYTNTKGKLHTAFLHQDGDYYTATGRSLSKPFLQLPLQKKYRISSRFNPYRKHPITHRKRPHNGVDLATPVGTPIVAPGDGIVSVISHHKYAGTYIVIEHNGAYATRYLHLSKPLVTEGQRVRRGDVIALSGNTGRSTGPHLHYELHVNGRPTNPFKAKVNASTSLPDEDFSAFTKQVDYYSSFSSSKR
jgi:murein DD-endopeptidase